MIKKELGQIFPLMLIAISVVLVGTLALIGGSQLYYQTANYSQDVEKATALAEAGVDKAIDSLNKTGGAYSGEAEISLGDGSYSVAITSKDAGTKMITSTGYIPNKDDPEVTRTIKIQASLGVGVAFVYGVQVGEGGIELGNSNIITGSIYSNGNVTGINQNRITGDAWVAGAPQSDPDQETECVGVNCDDFIFGKNVGSEDRMDIAQSFQPSVGGILNKTSLKLKKVGNPSDVVVRILRDAGGKPDKNGVLTQGTLYGSLVTAIYGWIDVTFATSPVVSADTTYWIMIDTTSDANNYWVWENDSAQSYTRGFPAWSPNWSTGNAVWNNFNGDLGFRAYLGGTPTSIRALNNMTVEGNVHANTIESLSIGGDAYFQTIVSSTVAGSSNPGSADPPPKVFPISSANIDQWRIEAFDNGGEYTGDITTCPTTVVSQRINGSVILGSNCNITIHSPIHITGDLTLNSNNDLILASSYGTSSGVIVVDGKITINSDNRFLGTGQGSSVLMALSAYDSRTDGIAAIVVNSEGNTGVFYAGEGIIEPGNRNNYKELTAWGIRLINNSNVNYETGLSSTLFSSGPGGAFTLTKGTYQVE
ncbi:MAG: choice-of-anchor R domain-containing protein [Candidatus Daviesbacteria bacterium]|nr:choice-of-anchor R domain-containing protein [Candidatus Daviesbacteria bacterium]